MDFSLTEQQKAFRDEIAEFARAELNDNVIDRDKSGEFSRANWHKCANFGIQGMAVPCEFGGTGRADILTAMLAMESAGAACDDLGLLFGLNAQMWTVQLPILQFGTEQQKKEFLPKFCSGEWIGAHAVTEYESGSDAFALQTTAVRCEGGYRLNGKKCMVTLAPVADVSLVFATIDPKLGKWGVTAFLLPSDCPGLEKGEMQHKMGLRTVPFGELRMKDCFVPESHRLGAEGSGFSLSQHSLEYERCCILASQIGAMERQLDVAVEHARSHKRFGKPIGSFQSVSNRVADMKVRIETARLLLYKVAWLKQQGQPAMLDAALLKLYLSECFVESSLDAIRIHGGHGYITNNGVERDLRDAVGGVLYAGTSDIQRNIIASLLGLS